MKIFRTDEEAVSPVIGVIFMVALVVILAAVIAASVFGMVGSATTPNNVGLTVEPVTSGPVGPGFDILWQGGSDLANLQSIRWTLNGAVPGGWWVYPDTAPMWFTQPYGPSITKTPKFQVGDVTRCRGGKISGKRLVITGTFSDGASQVLYDKTF